MSRGLGSRQRAVLDAVVAAPINDKGLPAWVSVDDVAHGLHRQHIPSVSVDDENNCPQGQHLAMAERETIRRAMRTLARAGLVDIGEVHQNRRRRGDHAVLAARRPLTDEECLRDDACNSRNWRDIWTRAGRRFVTPEEREELDKVMGRGRKRR
jgi:hypothetical protein